MRAVPSRLWYSPEEYVTYQLPVAIRKVQGSIGFEGIYNGSWGATDPVAFAVERMTEELARYEERSIISACRSTPLDPEFPADPARFALGSVVVPPMEADPNAPFGLLAQLAVPGGRATLRITRRSELLKGLVSMLVTMVAEKDAFPDLIAISPKDLAELRRQLLTLQDGEGRYAMRDPAFGSDSLDWVDWAVDMTRFVDDRHALAEAELRLWGYKGPTAIGLIEARHLPDGHCLALSYRWPRHWEPGERRIQREEQSPIEVAQVRDPMLLQAPPTGPSYPLEIVDATVVCCHAPFLQGWLEVVE